MTKQSYFLDNIKEISVEISGEKGKYTIGVYNDKTHIALNVSASKLLDLADFINKFVETHQ